MYLIASDFDGTLNIHGQISDEDRRAIKEFQAAGNLFGLCTGRPRSLLELVTEKYNLTVDFVLANNGALAVDGQGNTLYDYRGQNRDDMIYQLIVYLSETYGNSVNCILDRQFHSYHAKYPDGNEQERLRPLAETHDIKEFNMLSTIVPEDKIVDCCEYITKTYGDLLNPLRNGHCLDIPPAGTDKGEGVARYAALMGVPTENIYTVGDSMNDAAMITRFKGHAMKSGFRELLDIAPYQCVSVSELIHKIIG